MKKVISVIQARNNSSRLPQKVIMQVKDKTILEHCYLRAKQSKSDLVIIATSDSKMDDDIESLCKEKDMPCFRGSEQDVLNRILLSTKFFPDCIIIRLTADNPLVDPNVINYMVKKHIDNNNSVTTNYLSKTFPNGTVLSIMNQDVLDFMDKNYQENNIREHIVYGFSKLPKKYKVEDVNAPEEWNRYDIRFCLDYQEDFDLIKNVIGHFESIDKNPSTEDIIKYIDDNQDVKDINFEFAKQGY